MPPVARTAGSGKVTSRDPSTLADGECTAIVGGEYRIGSTHLHKQKGRSDTDATTASAPVRGICKLQYDDGEDVLVALVNGAIYESEATTTPSFTVSQLTGLTTTAVPHFCGFQNRWLMSIGDTANYVRESGTVPHSSPSTNWRPNGMQKPPNKPTATIISSTSEAVRPTVNSGGYTEPQQAYDTDGDTFAQGDSATVIGNVVHTFTILANHTGSGRRLVVEHSAEGAIGGQGPANPKFDIVDTGPDANPVIARVRYSVDSGSNFTDMYNAQGHISKTAISVPLDDSLDISNVSTNIVVQVSVAFGTHKIYDIRVVAGASTAYETADFPFDYGYTEVYVDSLGIEHESNLSSRHTVNPDEADGSFGVRLTFGPKVNDRTITYRIYRSIDSETGGYPEMYAIDEIDSTETSTTWLDDFHILPSELPENAALLSFFNVLFPTGEPLIFEPSGVAPISSMSFPFQGAVIYIPTDSLLSHRAYYSMASTISAASLEKVPAFQYLDFQSPKNDTIVGGAITNGGRSFLAFFAGYTMLVNYLPQATDGVFDNRVKEYVSNNRGCLGKHGCAEFTLPAGQTLVAAVDALGIWFTNGVSEMAEWSRDIVWEDEFAGVDLTEAILIDNTQKRRLELLYTDADGARQEYHLFYGRMKEGEAGSLPLLTGPHPMGVGSKHYTQIGSEWVGFSGSSASNGKIFLEGGADADEAEGYDATGIVPFTFTLGDTYIGGLSGAHILESARPKFTSELAKDITITGVFLRDSGHSSTHTKTFAAGTQSRVYWHKYCDRHRITFSDLTNTACPAFVGYEIDVSGQGPSRDA